MVPIMALTATLDEEQLQSLSRHYLKKPVLIRDSVNRPNIKLNVGRYTAKRPVKEGRNLVWMDVANEIRRIKELEELFTTFDGISEDKLISWLMGSKRDWIARPEIQSSINSSKTFAKGSTYNGKLLSRQWWQRHLRQLVSLGFIDISFQIIRAQTFTNTSREYQVSEAGKMFMEKPHSLKVVSPYQDPLDSSKTSGNTKRKTHAGGRGIHYLPKIRKAMSASNNWHNVTERHQYEFPGFQSEGQEIGFCKSIKDMQGFGSHQRVHFMWDDNQLTKRHTNSQVCQMLIDGKNTEVTVRRAPCEGVKTCNQDGCNYTVSNRQKKNKCPEHEGTHGLKSSGPCPAHLIYMWPTNDDGRRWVGIVPGLNHNHPKPAPHLISQETKEKIKSAMSNDSTLSTKDLQKGYGVGLVPAELSPAASNPERLRRERKRALKITVGRQRSIFPVINTVV